MAALNQLLYTARDALAAQSYGLGVTGQNISNVNTPGYVRRDALLETRALGTTTTGTVHVAGLRRATDIYLERREYAARGLAAAATERDQQLSSAEAMFNDLGGTGLGSSIDGVFSSFSALAANPGDATARRQVLASASQFAERANETGQALAQQKQDLLKEAQGVTEEVNKRAQAVAKLNGQIQIVEAQGEDAADLKDQRNQLLLNLADMVDIRTIEDAGGGMVVQASGGTLVDGNVARSMSVDLDSSGRMRIWSTSENGSSSEITNFLSGGKLAGIKETRDTDLFEISDKLDQLVFDVSNAINTQHAAGFGLDGGTGRDLFDVGATATNSALTLKVSVDVFDNPDAIAASGTAGALPGASDNAAKLADIFNTTLSSGNTAAGSYGDLIGDIGQRKSQAAQAVETQAAIRDQIKSMHDSISAVSLDEEMVNLTKFQRAYEASGRVLSVVDELLQDLINRIGR